MIQIRKKRFVNIYNRNRYRSGQAGINFNVILLDSSEKKFERKRIASPKDILHKLQLTYKKPVLNCIELDGVSNSLCRSSSLCVSRIMGKHVKAFHTELEMCYADGTTVITATIQKFENQPCGKLIQVTEQVDFCPSL